MWMTINMNSFLKQIKRHVSVTYRGSCYSFHPLINLDRVLNCPPSEITKSRPCQPLKMAESKTLLSLGAVSWGPWKFLGGKFWTLSFQLVASSWLSFYWVGPLGQFSLRVAMFVCLYVCLRHRMQFSMALIGLKIIWSVPRPLIGQPFILDNFYGHFLWTLFEKKKGVFIDTFCGHLFLDTFCAHFCGHFLLTNWFHSFFYL